MKFYSPAFGQREAIPARYSRQDANLSPPFQWSELPAGTQALALLCTDPDAERLWYHWVIFNIPASWSGLPGHYPRLRSTQGIAQGSNSFHCVGYDGPEPPRGEEHRYVFTLYALSNPLKLSPGVPGPQVLRAMQGKILAQVSWQGHFTG